MFILVAFFGLASCKSGKTELPKSYATSLENQAYQLLSIEKKDVTEMDLDLRIDAEKNFISGESGCNNYQFNYTLKEDVLDLGYGVATKMYCEETMPIENAFFGAASKVKHFSMSNDMLYFLDENGEALLTAKKRTKKEKE